MPFCAHICLIDEIISKISQNDLHILHNGHICQTCKIIRVNIELTIVAFILPTSSHANFECQQHPSLKPTQLAGSSPVATFGHTSVGCVFSAAARSGKQ